MARAVAVRAGNYLPRRTHFDPEATTAMDATTQHAQHATEIAPRRNIRRVLAALLAAFVLSAAMAACGGDDEPSGGGGDSTEQAGGGNEPRARTNTSPR